MKNILTMVSVASGALIASGCASPRYSTCVTSQPRESGQSMDFVAVKIDQKTGQAWWCQNSHRGEDSKLQWFPIVEGKK